MHELWFMFRGRCILERREEVLKRLEGFWMLDQYLLVLDQYFLMLDQDFWVLDQYFLMLDQDFWVLD